MTTRNQSKLIFQGIGLHRKAQKYHNAGKYERARTTKIQSNRILDGFNSDLVASHFALVRKNKK